MRDLFPGLYTPDGKDLDKLWDCALVVLDASVLLNLYKYPEQARTDLLSALERVRDRIWLPYQAAMEFQQGRVRVIADQLKKFSDARQVVGDFNNKLVGGLGNLQLAKRHSVIDPEPLLDGVKDLVENFQRELDKLERKQPRVDSHDVIRSNLDNLLGGRIGPPPSNQEALDVLQEEAQRRFDAGIPPGYKDEGTKGDSSFRCNGLRYTNKFGDYIFWRQLLDFVSSNQIKDVLLVTDDEKPDWWNLVESKGKVRLGPSVGLAEEYAQVAGGGWLVLYSSELFLNEARQRFNLNVSQESIDQVRDIVAVEDEQFSPGRVEVTFFHWLRSRHAGRWVERRAAFPDFVVLEAESRIAYEVKYLRRPRAYHLFPIVDACARLASQHVEEGAIDSFVLALVVTSDAAAEETHRGLKLSSEKLEINFTIEIYVIDQPQDEEYPHLRLVETYCEVDSAKSASAGLFDSEVPEPPSQS